MPVELQLQVPVHCGFESHHRKVDVAEMVDARICFTTHLSSELEKIPVNAGGTTDCHSPGRGFESRSSEPFGDRR